ncbi:MAG TPA: PP2C family protein-serine/threonine phosphatase, partial [Pyrinomonadaceae bacterium]|nr:PP2C family protein-serine/threonine phosphatase [Pyrinomonadaceae bacterium]
YAQGKIRLQDGDRLLLFTDGLSEAVDASGEQFGEDTLTELMLKHRHRTPQELKEILFNAVAEFCGHAFRDDAALIVVGVD